MKTHIIRKEVGEKGMTIRKFWFLMLAVLMLCTLGSCTQPRPSEKDNDDSGETPEISKESQKQNEKTDPNETNDLLALAEYAASLSATPYAKENDGQASFGLTDGQVGVNRAAFESDEVKYPFPDDSEFEVIVELAKEGVSPDNTPHENSMALSKAFFHNISVKGNKKYVFPNGEIKLASAVAPGVCNNLYITGSGDTHLIFTSWNAAFKFNNGSNVHLSNINFSWETPGMLTGKVIGYDRRTKTVSIRLDEKCKLSNEHDQVRGYYEMKPDEKKGYVVDMDKNLRYWYQDMLVVKNAEEGLIDIVFSSKPAYPVEEGTVVSCLLGCYQGDAAIGGSGMTDFYLENVHGDCLPGMGFVLLYSKNAYLNRFVLMPDVNRGVYFSTCWDGIHTVCLEGDFVITNSMIDGTEDDCLNVCADWMYVTAGSGKTLTAYTKNSAANVLVAAGDEIEIYSQTDFKPLGTYKVTEVTYSDKSAIMTLDKALEAGVCADNLIALASRATRLTLDNCIFSNCIGHGGLIQCRDTVIRNCSYSNLTMGGMRIHSAQKVYYEAILPRNILVTNCKFSDCGLGDSNYYAAIEVMAFIENQITTAGVLKQVKIENNFFTGMRGGGVTLFGVGESEVKHNLFYNVSRNTVKNDAVLFNTAVSCSFCQQVTVADNYTYVAQPSNRFSNVKIDEAGCTDVTNAGNVCREGMP